MTVNKSPYSLSTYTVDDNKFSIWCKGCTRQKYLKPKALIEEYGDLNMTDFDEKMKHFKCSKCGGRDFGFKIIPDYSDKWLG